MELCAKGSETMKLRNKLKKNKHFKNMYFGYFLLLILLDAALSAFAISMLHGILPYAWHIIAGVFIVLAIVSKFLADFISIRLYKPIDEMLGYFDDGEKDVTFLSRSVKSVINENEQLKEQLEISGHYIENNMLRDVLHGNPMNSAVLPEDAEISVIVGRCFVAYVECEFAALDKGDNKEREVTNLKKRCEKSVREHLEQSLKGKFVKLDEGKFAFISKPVEKSIITEKMLDLLNLVEETYKISLFIAIGKTVDGMSEISESFLGISAILERRFHLGKELVFVEDLNRGENSIYYPYDLERNLVNSVTTGNLESATECLSNIFEMNFIKRSLSKESVSDLKFAMTATIKRIIRGIGVQTEDIFGEGSVIYLELSSVGSDREFMMSIRKMVEKICAYQTSLSKESKGKLSDSIAEYVKKNYKDNISILTMSEELFVSQSHINRIMRTEFASTFKAYLDGVRIDAAKNLLASTSLNINVISEEVGFNSTRTFLRVFKKQVGCLPSEYREMKNN